MKHYAMTRTYAAKRLLEHGPLTQQEFTEITGWKDRQAERVLQQLLDSKVVTCRNQWTPVRKHYGHCKTRLYALASSITADGFTDSTGTMQTQPLTTMQRSFHG